MNKIYVIVEGEYSDWNIIGYFKNKDDAEKYSVIDDSYYILEIEELTIDNYIRKTEITYVHTIIFDIIIDKIKMRNEPDRYEVIRKTDLKTKMIYRNLGWIRFEVCTKERKKAEKIAQDYAYEFLELAKQFGAKEAYLLMEEKLK